MTRGSEPRQADRGSARRQRALAGFGTAAAAGLSASLIIALALYVPVAWHLLLAVLLACACAAGARAATRRARHRHATVLVLAAVLPLVFCQWSVRHGDLFRAANSEMWAYLGLANLCLAAFIFGAARVTRARAFAPLGVLAAALSLMSIGASLFPASAPSSRIWLGTVLVAYAGASWPLFRRSRAARITARSVAAVASVAALAFAAGAWPGHTWATALSFLMTAGALAVQLFASPVAVDDRDGPAPRTRPIRSPLPNARRGLVTGLGVWKTTSAIGLGLALSGAAAVPATLFGSFSAQINVTAGLTAIGAVLLALASRRFLHDRSAPGLRVAGLVSLLVCALTVVPVIGITIIELWTRISLPNFTVHAVAVHELVYPDVSPFSWISAAALTVAVAATLSFWGRFRSFSWLTIGLGGATLLIAHATAQTAAASVLASCVLALAATALFLVLRPRRGRRRIVLSFVLLSVTSSFLVGANSSALWPVTALIAIGCVGALRFSLPYRFGDEDRLAIAPVLGAIFAAFVLFTARWIPLWAAASFDAPTAASALATVIAASAIIVTASVLTHRSMRADASAATALATLAALLGIGELATHTNSIAHLHFVIALSCVLAAELSWQFARGARASAARYVTAVLTPPTAVMLAVESWRQFGPSIWGAPELLAVGIAVVLAALGIVLFRDTPASSGEPRSHPARLGWDSSIALTSIVTVPAALTTSDFGALNLLLLGVLPVLFAFGEGSITRSRRMRRHLVWACIPPFGGAVLLTIGQRGPVGVEVYALAVACLMLAALVVVASRRPPAQAPRPPGRNLLTIGVLAAFLVPSALVTGAGPVGQSAVLLVIAGVLAVLGAVLPPVVRGIHLALWLWSAGVLTGALTSGIRAFGHVARAPFTLDELLVWGLCAAVFVAGFGALWLRRGHPQPLPAIIAIASAPLLLALPFANVAATSPVPWWMLSIVAAVTTTFIGFPLKNGNPAHALIPWMATTGAVFLTVGAMTGAYSAIEFVSVPVGLVAIALNLRTLAAHAEISSWRALGLPLGALIVPSLLQCLTDPAPFRIAWLVICIAATAAFGVVTSFKAPLAAAAISAFVLGLTLVWPAAISVAPAWIVLLILASLTAIACLVFARSQIPVARAVRHIARMR